MSSGGPGSGRGSPSVLPGIPGSLEGGASVKGRIADHLSRPVRGIAVLVSRIFCSSKPDWGLSSTELGPV